MLLANSSGWSSEKIYSSDVFSTYLYSGNGSTQTINNGIDLAGKGGMVWGKSRSNALTSMLFNSASGVTKYLVSSATDAESTNGSLAFGSSGFTAAGDINQVSQNYTSWTFRKAPKFFDVVTFTYSLGASVNHALGSTPAVVIIKNTSSANDWQVYHKDLGAVGGVTPYLSLNASFGVNTAQWLTALSATSLTFSGLLAGSYVAYLFAHDTSADGIIQCGSFTTDGSGNATVNTIGWEPQWGMFKASSGTGDWLMLDQMRGWNMTANDAKLAANTSAAEVTTTEYGNPTATGFEFKGGSASTTYIYMVIRRPNKPPTTGTEVLGVNAALSSATMSGSLTAYNGFPTPSDAYIMFGSRSTPTTPAWLWADRLRGYPDSGYPVLDSSTTSAEVSRTTSPYIYNTGGYRTFVPSANNIVYGFRRAPGFMDIVCWKGTGVAGGVRQIAHNLGVMPELTISKERSGNIRSWAVSYKSGADRKRLNLEDNSAASTLGYWDDAFPTSSTFDEYFAFANQLTSTCVTYLFASTPGISKIGTFTGNGSSQTINCGFSAGARFILIKRTDSTGDWYVWDSVRGIVAANDPHLSLNTTAAEVTTDDSVDPNAIGFDVLQNTATNINVLNATYIYLAIA